MKKISLCLCCLFASIAILAQKDTTLERRLAEFMQANEKLEFSKVLDYTYAKLFTIVPRNQMLEILQNTFDNENMSIKLDSLRIDSIYPVFKLENGSYAKVIYSFNMFMLIKYPDGDSLSVDEKKEKNDFMVSALGGQYGENNVSIDPITGFLKIQVTSPMAAVKDQIAKQWSFVNLKEKDPLMDRLFDKEVLKRLASYK
jgi:hypothetical protein